MFTALSGVTQPVRSFITPRLPQQAAALTMFSYVRAAPFHLNHRDRTIPVKSVKGEEQAASPQPNLIGLPPVEQEPPPSPPSADPPGGSSSTATIPSISLSSAAFRRASEFNVSLPDTRRPHHATARPVRVAHHRPAPTRRAALPARAARCARRLGGAMGVGQVHGSAWRSAARSSTGAVGYGSGGEHPLISGAMV